MPRILAQLLAVELLLHSFVEVEGQCFLELFAGQAVLTVALIFKNAPCCKPRDSKWGEHMDGLKHAEQYTGWPEVADWGRHIWARPASR